MLARLLNASRRFPMSRCRWFPLLSPLMALAIGAPAHAQHRGGNTGGGWPPPSPVHGGRVDSPPMAAPGPQGRGGDPRAMPSMEASIRPRPGPSDCGRGMMVSPGDQLLAVQPVDFGGRVQCRVKIMGADGMVRVMMVGPGD